MVRSRRMLEPAETTSHPLKVCHISYHGSTFCPGALHAWASNWFCKCHTEKDKKWFCKCHSEEWKLVLQVSQWGMEIGFASVTVRNKNWFCKCPREEWKLVLQMLHKKGKGNCLFFMPSPSWRLHQGEVTVNGYIRSLFLTASQDSPSHGAVLLPALRAHGDREHSLWQVWVGALAAHAVHLGEAAAQHLLAGLYTFPSVHPNAC